MLQKKNLKSEKRNTRKIPRNIRRKRKRERKARRVHLVKVKMKTPKHSHYLLSVLKKFLLYLKTGS